MFACKVIIIILVCCGTKLILECLLTPQGHALESGINVGQGISVGPGKFVKKNKRRALNKPRA